MSPTLLNKMVLPLGGASSPTTTVSSTPLAPIAQSTALWEVALGSALVRFVVDQMVCPVPYMAWLALNGSMAIAVAQFPVEVNDPGSPKATQGDSEMSCVARPGETLEGGLEVLTE